MNPQLIVEHYLSQLERELHGLPTGERAVILTEVRSQIMAAMKTSSDHNVQKILQDLGTAQDVAKRHLAAKGIAYTPAKTSGLWLKGLAFGLAGVCILFVGLTAFAIWRLSPILHVDEQNGRVKILGGLIDVNETAGEVKIGSMRIKDTGANVGSKDAEYDDVVLDDDTFSFHVGGRHSSKGVEDLVGRSIKKILVPFNTAKLEVRTSQSNLFYWECKNLSPEKPLVDVQAGVMTLNLHKLNLAKCKLQVPKGIQTEIQGINGSLELEKPEGDYQIQITNAKVEIEPEPSRVYDFEVSVVNGMQDENLKRSSEKGALKVKVDVVNGVVKED